MTVDDAVQMFPDVPRARIEANLPPVLAALQEAGLGDDDMVLVALATIRAETAGFLPISEGISRFNTSGAPEGHPFDLYDNRADLGNQGAPDGAQFKGRGFVQLTGRANYQQHSQAIGLADQLVDNPDQANDPATAAKILASFLKSRETRIRAAIAAGDLAGARKLVNGGSYGLEQFATAFQTGSSLLGAGGGTAGQTTNA